MADINDIKTTSMNNPVSNFLGDTGGIESAYLQVNIPEQFLAGSKGALFVHSMVYADLARTKAGSKTDELDSKVNKAFYGLLPLCQTDDDYKALINLSKELASHGGYAAEFYSKHFSREKENGISYLVKKLKFLKDAELKLREDHKVDSQIPRTSSPANNNSLDYVKARFKELYDSLINLKSTHNINKSTYEQQLDIWRTLQSEFAAVAELFDETTRTYMDNEIRNAIEYLNTSIEAYDNVANIVLN